MNVRGVVIIYGALACGSLAACAAPVDLSAVQTYAKTTAAAGASFSALADDFQGSCLRYNDIQNYVIQAPTAASAPVLVGIPSPAQLTAAASIQSVGLDDGYTFVPSSADTSAGTGPSAASPAVSAPRAPPPEATCQTAARVSAAWNAANGVVLDYVQSLGNLADVDAIPTPNPSPLVGPLESAGVSSEAVQSATAILSSITDFFNRQASERYIRSFLATVNPSMRGATQALQTVDAAYSIELQDEFTAIGTQYAVYARGQLRRYRNASPGERATIARELLDKRAVVIAALRFVNERRTASAAYGDAIEGVYSTHERLYEASLRNAAWPDYLNIIQTTGAPVLTNLDNLIKAVK